MAKPKKKKTSFNTFQNSTRSIINKSKPILGIDIGSSTLKIVQMKKNHKFDKWALESIPIGMVNKGKIEVKEPLVKIIKTALKKNKIKTKDCALYLSADELIVRELTFPEMEDVQIRENIKQEISIMLPEDYDEYYIDYKIIEYIKSEDELEGQIRVLAAAVPMKLLNDYIDTLKQAGLKVKYIDVLPNIGGKLCSLIYNKKTSDKPKNICMIDFGSKKTEIIIYQNGNYYLHKTVNYGGDYLTSSIAGKSGMDEIDAEDYKYVTAFFERDREDPLVSQVYEYFDYLIVEFERTMEFYTNRSQESIERIYIMGGGSLLEGLPEYLEEQLGMEVKHVGDIFDDFKEVGAIGRHISVFSQAIGVTFREEWKYEG